MHGIKVSIIMPVYNTEQYLKQSISSALEQSLKQIELICVDDGSQDGSYDILRNVAEYDDRVVVIRQENSGSAIARNRAIDQACGEYIAFLDSDDFYPSSTVLERLYTNAVEHDALICGGSFSRYRLRRIETEFTGKDKGYRFEEEGFVNYKDYQFDYGYHRFLYMRSFLKEKEIFFPNLLRWQDPPFMVKSMICAGGFYAIPDVVYCYRKDERSKPIEWSSEKFRDLLKGITINLKLSKENGLKKLHVLTIDRLLDNSYIEAIRTAIYRHNYKTIQVIIDLWSSLSIEMIEQEKIEIPDDVHNMLTYAETLMERRKNGICHHPVVRPVKVTVIIPSLNVEPYITSCLESVSNQMEESLEILCIDAGSTDGTLEIIEEFAAFDERIRLIHSDRKSYGYQVNIGIKEATGEYIAILESDDMVELDMYGSLYSKATENALDVIKGDYNRFAGDGVDQRMEYCRIADESVGQMCYSRVFVPSEEPSVYGNSAAMYIWAGIYRTRFLRDNRIFANETPGASYQDNGFWFQVMMCARRMMLVPKAFYHLRRDNPNSSVLSSGKRDCMKVEYDFIRENIRKRYGDTRKDYIHLCAFFRFKNYIFTYNRISEAERLQFLIDIQKEFLILEKKGELDPTLFPEDSWQRIASIMDDPERFYTQQINNLRGRELRIIREEAIHPRKYVVDAGTLTCMEQSLRKPSVSVILPSYNVAPYIKKCIESVLTQSMKDIEIICVDAESEDGTAEILDSYARKDGRVRFFSTQRKSYGFQVNYGISLAKGEYISIVETDDYIAPFMLEKLYYFAKKNGVQVVKSNYYRIYEENGVEQNEKMNYIPPYIREREVFSPDVEPLVHWWDAYIWNGIYKREFLEQEKITFQETEGAAYQDIGFEQQVLNYADSILYIREPLYHYRIDRPNASSCVGVNGVKNVCREYKRLLDSKGIKKSHLPYIYSRMIRAFLVEYDKYINTYGNTDMKCFEDELKWFCAECDKILNNLLYSTRLINGDRLEALSILLHSPEDYVEFVNGKQ